MLEPKPVLCSEQQVGSQKLGFIQLNRERALNSLNLEMVQTMYQKLLEWETRADIAAIFLYSESSKGFCAGGDVKAVVLSLKENREYSETFFHHEYLVDELLSRYKKPVFCWGSGFVMGGGLGLFMASSHRIVTDDTIMSMPETAIGFFPDVGASYFLNKIPGKFGWMMGLSGHRISGTDAVCLGMAQTIVAASMRRKFVTDLLSLRWNSSNEDNFILADEFIKKIQYKPNLDLSPLLEKTNDIFSQSNLENCLQIWSQCEDPVIRSAYSALKSSSAHSSQVIWRQLEKGSSWSRAESTWREWDIAANFSATDDFSEGVRAVLIDKDKAPKWSTAPLTSDQIEAFFVEQKNNPIRTLLS